MAREAARRTQCVNNLKVLYNHAIEYSDKSGTRVFPFSPKGSLDALRLMIDWDWDADREMKPEMFVCPKGSDQKPRVENGKVVLTNDTCSYEIVPWRVRNTAMEAILIYDKWPCHDGKRNVVFLLAIVMSVRAPSPMGTASESSAGNAETICSTADEVDTAAVRL